MARPKIAKIAPDEAATRLPRELPRWSVKDGALVRIYRFHGWKGTALAFGAVAHLAEAAWHHPDVVAGWGRLEVRLSTHEVGGISERDFALAKKIEEIVAWRPGDLGGALEGTPEDPASAYLKRDD
ncbi:MAG: 4a-hydroxytetrahydrobiopterin dehydratase [Hyphomicrobiales bacterium]|nr:4a-hydroxytetrahydrobiopterin dehydratase [Hyphomicrobiales bacterium]MDE2016543.1 4a-hydroxytetrahydrobiopterin dehydratase [Hyphomicrobiales bacterium]